MTTVDGEGTASRLSSLFVQYTGEEDPVSRGDIEPRDGSKPDRLPRSPVPTDDQRTRWRDLGPERFHDAEYQRYARSFRSTESLREAGRRGYAETARKYGADFAADRLADWARAHPEKASREERAMVDLLSELGQEADRDYQRQYKVAPRTYVDFAWPEQGKIVEVYGSIHTSRFGDLDGTRAEDDARRVERIEALGWEVKIVAGRDVLRREYLEATREEIRDFLDATGQRERPPALERAGG